MHDEFLVGGGGQNSQSLNIQTRLTGVGEGNTIYWKIAILGSNHIGGKICLTTERYTILPSDTRNILGICYLWTSRISLTMWKRIFYFAPTSLIAVGRTWPTTVIYWFCSSSFPSNKVLMRRQFSRQLLYIVYSTLQNFPSIWCSEISATHFLITLY